MTAAIAAGSWPWPAIAAFWLAGALLIAALAVRIRERRRPRERRCIHCGCTDLHGCAAGCWWWNYDPPICSRCATDDDLHDAWTQDDLFPPLLELVPDDGDEAAA